MQIHKEITIQTAHRTSTTGKGNGNNRPRVIVLQLLNYEDKETILSACHLLKNTDFYISQDFCKNTVAIHKKLWHDVKELRKEGHRAFLGYRKIEMKGRYDERK